MGDTNEETSPHHFLGVGTQVWDSSSRILVKPGYSISVAKWKSISTSETELDQTHGVTQLLGEIT